jgi:glycosyltransferase involved in cell wall biosynthesis
MPNQSADLSPLEAGATRTEKLAFLLPNLNGGGAERVALRLITSFIQAGYRVELVLVEKRGELLEVVPEGVEIIDLKAARMRSAILPLMRYFRDRPPHAIQVRLWPLTVVGIIARQLARSRVRIVVSDHIALSKQYGDNPLTLALLKLSTRFFYPKADARVVVAKGSADDLAQLSGISRSSIEVIYNPVTLPPVDPAADPAIEALWGSRKGRILTVGSLKSQKNHELLIRSFAKLRRRRPAKLMILGEGELRASLEELARVEGVAEDVIFPGFTTNPWPYYQSADMFVLSSDYEGYPNVLVEAMRCGLTVVSTDCESGPNEILDGGTFGRLVPVGDEQALADAMELGLTSPLEPDLMKERAEKLSGSATTERYLRLLLGD